MGGDTTLRRVMQLLQALLSEGPKRQNLLGRLIPAILLVYFGSLAAVVGVSHQAYDWRRRSISWLLYPGNNPSFHFIASLAIAVTGLLMVPFAAFIRVRLKSRSMIFTDLGVFQLRLGALLLVLAGLIVSHPSSGKAGFPRLHEELARGSALALGIGIFLLWLSAIRTWLNSTSAVGLHLRRLLVAWSLLLMPAILVAGLRLLAYLTREWSGGVFAIIQNRSLWQLGFWEWIGSGGVFLFLLSSALFLPDPENE
jgi:hypothetical protein